MSTAKTIETLRTRLSELAVDLSQRQVELNILTREHDALKLALKSLENIQDDVLERAIADEIGDRLTYRQTVVFENIPLGRENALPPSLIAKRCLSIDADYVRKTLKRMSDSGRINSYDSKYWRDD